MRLSSDMKRIMSLVFLLLLNIDAYGISEREKVYKEEMELLSTMASKNSSNRRISEISMKDAAEMYQLCKEQNSTNKRFQMDCSIHETNKEMGETDLREANKKRDDILKEVAEIKAKLMEKFGKLPEWWKASEKTIMDQINK